MYALIGNGSVASSTTGMLPGTPIPGLVINEIDYDDVGADLREFIEVYNPGAAAVDLAGYDVVLVNGADNSVYRTFNLGTLITINAGQYLVIGTTALLASVPPGALTIACDVASDCIQNGSPDGAAIVNTKTNTIVDAISYEGAITAANIPGVGTVTMVEGTAISDSLADSNTIPGSLCRFPNGTDTNNAASDWGICSTSTPGAANSL